MNTRYALAMEEQTFSEYVCTCGFQKEVAEEYDLASNMFFPVSIKDAICPVCQTEMDRVRRAA